MKNFQPFGTNQIRGEQEAMLIQQKRSSYEAAKKTYKETAEKFNLTQDKTRADFTLTIEKMGLYSAGIISLSITFLGYLISQDRTILLENFLKLPLYAFLFTSWCLLSLSLIMSLLERPLEAKMAYAFWHSEFLGDMNSMQTKEYELLSSDPGIIVCTGTKESNMQTLTKNADTLKDMEKKSRKKYSFYYNTKRAIHLTACFSFGLGVVSLVIFAIVSSHRLLTL